MASYAEAELVDNYERIDRKDVFDRNIFSWDQWSLMFVGK